ncbi:Fe-S cluster assembly protein SufD [Schaalia sp. 19OD2882]|uniref:Fe-S cluster assembly protein SufD n=1 Tax=Schaalia sp. 19OD2882 TaxID=2794089 RepID=UPI001C1EB1BE|nr:Fe-S cluster assembly protein SufD [Schaalia sp. 19OD2882]QWW18755.1 Fe-S cluster assembly protein SufD [Schaalia sp. 19OD2882]
MTTSEGTVAATAARPHSHGLAPSRVTRADRLASFDLDAFPFPTGREEDWRFTPMRRIERLLHPEDFDEGDAPLALRQLPDGVSVHVVERGDEALGTVLAPTDRAAAVAWDRFESATVVTIAAQAVLDSPVLLDVSALEGTRAQNVVIRAGELCEATVILTHSGGAGAALAQGIEVEAGDGCHLSVVAVHEWDDTTIHTASHRVAIGRDAQVRHIVVTLGGDLVRVNAETDFRGPGGNLEMLGLYFVDAGQHLEHRVFVDHSQPKCYSRVTYKGALQGKDAHSVWIGDCLIREVADGTDTYELNRNLVLTEGAKADSVPNLEIENGEIEGAGHASATGRFDDEQLFYLMSRGIPEVEARRLVVRGFFAELIDQIGVPAVQEHLMAAIEAELARSAQ